MPEDNGHCGETTAERIQRERQSVLDSGCVWCDAGKIRFDQDGKFIHYINMMRNEQTPCTKPLT